ncbi:MAG TPA: NAD-dependent epimerase/dehydratase family protein [Hanamia sp.]|jgi:UDP-2-acetamido-2,6-beta-L-arabino-hexul-4-ose reductase|nr:NAD-dependent epimerase/dehydratase family protein [Hanamia sp.]
MVIGNGMIANRFMDYKKDDDIIIFASGVSNSKDTIEQNFSREFELLEKTIKNNAEKILVYFSSCSVEDEDLQNVPYVIHKRNIEKFIQQNATNYYLFRISNVAGVSNNPYTLLNYFILNILQNNIITVWKNAYRNIIGIDDMYSIANIILQEEKLLNTTLNIANPENYSVPSIIRQIEEHLHKKAIFNEIEKGDNYTIDISVIEPIIKKLGIHFNDDYLASILKRYYHSK